MALNILAGREITVVPLDPVPEQHTVSIASVCVASMFVAWTAVILRFITRSFINRSLGWDDWIMLAALVPLSIFLHAGTNGSSPASLYSCLVFLNWHFWLIGMSLF
jgi:hypothetical protein